MIEKRLAELIPILVVDDDKEDQDLIEIGFRRNKIANPIYQVYDGEALLKFIYNEPPYEDKEQYPEPGLILLDLNMPKVSGREALQVIKSDPRKKHIPIVVLTTSSQEEDILQTYDLGANSFITKPVALTDFIALFDKLGNYWLGVVSLPQHE